MLAIRLLGEFSSIDDRGNAIAIGNKRTQALLIHLAVRLGEPVTFHELNELLGGGAEAESAVRGAIRDLQYALRGLTRDPLIVTDHTVLLNIEEVTVDATQFEAVSEGASINHVRQAAEIYRGNLAEGFHAGIPRFEEWIAAARLEFWHIAVSVFSKLLSAQVKAGWWEAAVETASRLLAIDPSQEVVHRTLMRMQLEQGRPDAALRRFQECSDILRREFHRGPSAETERLHGEIIEALKTAPAPREAFRKPIDRPVLVLLVEDDLVSAALMEGYLADGGYEVVSVNDGAEALMEISRRTFDLLVLDINIPRLNGLQLFEIMMQKGIETPAIFVTGIAGPDIEARSLEIGAADFLRKPVRREVLLPRLRAILQRKERAGSAQR